MDTDAHPKLSLGRASHESSMTMTFTPIRIVGIDDGASGKSGLGASMMRIVLDLSDYAPPEWETWFNQRWSQHIYMMKRRATVSGKKLEIHCVADELERDHLPELRSVIDEANFAYMDYLSRRQASEAAQQAAQAATAAKVSELKKNIKFD